MANKQSMKVQTNTQTTHEKDNILKKNEECGESVEEVVEKDEEERMFDGYGVVKIMKEIYTPQEIELPQEWPCTNEANTVDNEEVMIVAEKNDGLFSKEISCELKKEMEYKAEIDQVIDEICALFNKKTIGEDLDSTTFISKVHGVPPKPKEKDGRCAFRLILATLTKKASS
ncbi:hypothetical protein QL285_006609 [Trifolium repens]|nr:hypothetical protein QL285_006609 [Trifolium repens]